MSEPIPPTDPSVLVFGGLVPPLTDQLGTLITTDEQFHQIEHLDRDAKAVARLVIRGFITESVARKTRDKIAKSVWAVLGQGKAGKHAE